MAHSSQLFLHEAKDKTTLGNQVKTLSTHSGAGREGGKEGGKERGRE